jgi:hypothetical protein
LEVKKEMDSKTECISATRDRTQGKDNNLFYKAP